MSIVAAQQVQILLVEMQPLIVASSRTQDPAALKRSVAALTRIAHDLRIPMTASVVRFDQMGTELIDEVGSLKAMPRGTVGVFADPACRERLAEIGRSTVLLAGVSSEIAVLHAALGARREAYDVVVLADCCGGLDARTEAAVWDLVRTRGATVSSVSSFFTGLFDDMESAEGAVVMGALAELWKWGAPGQRRTPAEEAAAVLEELVAAWRAGDAGRFAAQFADEARFVAFDGSVLHGRREVAKFHEAPFATYLRDSVLIVEPASIRSVAADVLLIASRGGVVRSDAHSDLVGDSAQTFVLSREPDGMKILSFQNTRIRPLGEDGATRAWQTFDRAWRERGEPS